MQKLLLLIMAVVLVGCGKKEDGKPQSNAKTPPPTTSTKSEPQTEPIATDTEEVKPLPKDFKSLKTLAEKGDARAQYELAFRYASGNGVPENLKETAKWYLKAAEQGHVDAQFMIGGMYLDGEGVEFNLKEGVKWYSKAAEQGDSDAQSTLASMYEDGRGVEQDYVTAYAWADILNDPSHRDKLANKMTPEQIAKAEVLVKEMIKKNPKLLK